MDREPLAKPAEVARHLGVKERTLTNWRYRNQGPKWIKRGTARQAPVRYRWSDVEAWLEQQSNEAADSR